MCILGMVFRDTCNFLDIKKLFSLLVFIFKEQNVAHSLMV